MMMMMMMMMFNVCCSIFPDESCRHPSRSTSVYQRKPEPAYVLVQGPRQSRANDSFLHSSISPSPEDVATQGDIFNDNFLRQMNPSPHESSSEPEPKEESILETKRSVTPNIYEEKLPPENTKNNASVYDTVPPPRFASGSVTSQSSLDSVPAFPPPSSEEAIETLQRFMTADRSINEGSNADARSQNNPTIYENFYFGNQDDANTVCKQDGGAYDNVAISNRPVNQNLEETETHIVVPNSENDDKIEVLQEKGKLSGIKQNRTRDSSREGQGSRPASTLNESYEWSKVRQCLQPI